MDKMDYFMELYGNLPRAGPGDNASTRKAYEMIEDMPPEPRILDIGCGPGVQTVEIAKLSGGTVVALDLMPQMINRVKETVAEQGLADRIEIIRMDMNKMDFAIESFDLIWAEGAIYLMGFKNGLEKARKFLNPDISIIDKKLKVIADLGYQKIGHFVIPDTSWTEPYYEPLEERSKELEVAWKDEPVAMEVIHEAKEEIEMFRKYHEFYGYCFFVMRKSLSAK